MSNIPFDNRDGLIWKNGDFIPWKKATCHVINQGLHYASAVFEGERAYNGKIFKSEEFFNIFPFVSVIKYIRFLFFGLKFLHIL